MRILCTMPGRLGDIFWSLATVRKIAESYQEAEVHFVCSPKYAACLPIVKQQSYVSLCYAAPCWDVQETAPMTPTAPPMELLSHAYDHVLHLGYTRWPELPLAFEVAERHAVPLTGEDLARPWIRVKPAELSQPWNGSSLPLPLPRMATGFTDEWFELKVGLTVLLGVSIDALVECVGCSVAPGSRWHRENNQEVRAWNLSEAAARVQAADLFLGDLSALAVLAAAMGKPRVLVEPNPQRHHPIFQHWDTPLVIGSDNLPTFDARHVADAVRAKLKWVKP